MKANEMPERIYLFDYSDAMVTPLEGDTTYVREDAFIEKAVNFLEMLGYGFTITDNITHKNYDKEQLIEDFKNYMEGKEV